MGEGNDAKPAAVLRDHRHPLIAALETGAIDEQEFWRRVEAAGTPLVEDGAADGHALVTFVWRLSPEAEHATALTRLGENADNAMNTVRGTRVSHLSYRFRDDLRLSYGFGEDLPIVRERDATEEELARLREVQASTRPRPDPFNGATFAMPAADPAMDTTTLSLFAFPKAPDESLAEKRPSLARGWIHTHEFASHVLGNERRVWVQTPAEYEDSSKAYGILVVFDGGAYRSVVPTHRILDNLTADGLISPLIGVYVDNATPTSRNTELPCNARFATFLRDELIPWLHAEYRVSEDPTASAVAGSSFGGLAAMWIAHELPEVFGNVISQAGSFWWGPEVERSASCPGTEGCWMFSSREVTT
jgi:enterochelin esterase-like enzyme